MIVQSSGKNIQARGQCRDLRLFGKEFGQGVRQQRVRDKRNEKAGTLPLTLRMIQRVRNGMVEELQALDAGQQRIVNSAKRQNNKKRNLCNITRWYAYEILKFEASSNNVSFSNDCSREVTAMKYVLFQLWSLKWNFLKSLFEAKILMSISSLLFLSGGQNQKVSDLYGKFVSLCFPQKSLGIVQYRTCSF